MSFKKILLVFGFLMMSVPVMASPILPAPSPTPKLSYYGGPVIPNVQVYAVYWGPNVSTMVTGAMADFYKGVVETNYMDWLSEYNTAGVTGTNGHASTNQVIGRGSFEKEIVLQPFNTSMSIKDSEIRVELEAQIKAGNLPTPNENTLFMIDMPPGMTISYDTLPGGGISCQNFCAYHSDYHRADNSFVFYGVLPDYSTGTCAPPSCGAGTALQNFTSATSHELIESVTDPAGDDVKSGSDYPMAWWWDAGPSEQGEIGDICSYVSPDGKVTGPSGTVYDVQGEWSNSRVACYPGPNGVAQ